MSKQTKSRVSLPDTSIVMVGGISLILLVLMFGFGLGWYLTGRDEADLPANALPKNPTAAAGAGKILYNAPNLELHIEPTVAPVLLPTPMSVQIASRARAALGRVPDGFVAGPHLQVSAGRADPVPPFFGPHFNPNDGLPIYVCGMEAFPSYLNMQLIQMLGTDVEHGFHLGIVPIELEETPLPNTNGNPYEIDEDRMRGFAQQGDWDCIIEEIDEDMIGNYGIVTALVDETIGSHAVWGRDMHAYTDLVGKRVAVEAKSSAHFFLLYVLSLMPAEQRNTVTVLPMHTYEDAIDSLLQGKADAISVADANPVAVQQAGATSIISSEQLRVIANSIVTSRKAVQTKPELVQAFHNAWFSALQAQLEDYDAAAELIARWGHHDWMGVPASDTSRVFRSGFAHVAQAGFQDNINVMQNVEPIIDRLSISTRLWREAGFMTVDDPPNVLIDSRFVLQAANDVAHLLQLPGKPLNDRFTLASIGRFDGTKTNAGNVSVIEVSAGEALPVDEAATDIKLPCRHFSFKPNSAQLTEDSQRILDFCVVPILKQRAGLYLQIKGSAAWPRGSYTEKEILNFGMARARAIGQYLMSRQLDPSRFVITSVLPTEDHRGISDAEILAADRYVEMTLLTGP